MKYTTFAAGIDMRLTKLLNTFATRSQDIYQFGVYTGTGLAKIAKLVHNFGHLYGFDSFQGLPTETGHDKRVWEELKMRAFQKGGFSAADALREYDLEKLMAKVQKLINAGVVQVR